ncbi:MAG: cytochrome c biogenesis protein [Thermoguttaceae bacterium]
MRIALTTLALLVAASALATPTQAGESSCDWDQWGRLAVQDGGRSKPLDSLAWETLRMIANRGSFEDPQTSEKLSPVAVYLKMLFDWGGWEATPTASTGPHGSHGMTESSYFQLHKPDRWDRSNFIRVDFLALRQAMGLPLERKHFSPLEISEASLVDPETGKAMPFVRWSAQLVQQQDEDFTLFETKALEVADKFWSYREHRMGRRMRVLPIAGSADEPWLSLSQLMQAPLDDSSDPTGDLRQLRRQVAEVRGFYLQGKSAEFNRASGELISRLADMGPKLGVYPEQRLTDLEVAYNHWAPFRYAWILSLFAFLGAMLAMATRWKPFYRGAVLLELGSLVLMSAGFGMRMAISGRAPVTNMYESVIYVGLGVALFGLVFEMIYRKGYVLTAAAALTTVALVLADNCSVLLDPTLKPLQPVLRNNFWLVIHVLSITLSYGAFALALGIANITLGHFIVRSRNADTVASLNLFTYRTLQVGVLLLAIGTILGGVWADYAWGRFWGWDPKEVWALIALLGYVGLLHARYVGWVGQFGLAAWSVFCFSLVVVAWYGVNFVLGAGLHSYGFGGGGKEYVGAALVLQFAYVLVAWLRSVQARNADALAAAPRGNEPATA